MKRTISSLLVLVLMLNVLGYYGIFLGLHSKASKDISVRAENNDYDPAHEIIIKTPLAIPYMNETPFVRAQGDFEYEGEFYTLVKQRLANDTLYVVCVKNVEAKRISKALAEYVKTFASESTDNAQGKSLPSFIKDFIGSSLSIESCVKGWAVNAQAFGQYQEMYSTLSLTTAGPPPRG